MDSWFQQQRQQTKLSRLQQKDATENLQNYKMTEASRNTKSVKDEMKKKEQEAAEMLRNYRGQPEAILSHQVKKHAKDGVFTINKNFTQADVVAPLPSRKLETASGGFVLEDEAPSPSRKLETVSGGFVLEDGNSTCTQSERDRSGSYGTTDWSLVSGHDSSSEGGLSSTPVNVDLSLLADAGNNGPDVAAGLNTPSVSAAGYDTALSQSYVDTTSDVENEWTIRNISVSFGLLIHENDQPPEGSFSSPIQNEIVDNVMFKMRIVAEKSLAECTNVTIANQKEFPISITIQRDVNYTPPTNRPGVQRNLVKATISLNTVHGDLQAVSNAKTLVYNTMKMSLSDLTSKA